ALPQWSGGKLAFIGALPWQYTEYPTLYSGPCNVNRDASVKPTDATMFLFAHADCKRFRPAMEMAEIYGRQGEDPSRPLRARHGIVH
ncbi:unnamed protein product, partial [Polarella glacialis]